MIIQEGTYYSETSVNYYQQRSAKFGRAKASTFQVFTNCKASSLDGMRRKTNYLNNI
jgi:hypothetical protein